MKNKKHDDFMNFLFRNRIELKLVTEKEKSEIIRNERKKKLERIYGKRNFE